MRMRLALALLALLAHACSAQSYQTATAQECRAAGWPVNVWRGKTSLRCPPDPMDPELGHESDFPGFTYTGRRVVDAGVR